MAGFLASMWEVGLSAVLPVAVALILFFVSARGPLAAPIRATGLFLLFWPSLWLGLRYGLDEDDKAALGKFGKRLRL